MSVSFHYCSCLAKWICIVLCVLCSVPKETIRAHPLAIRERISFNDGWLFIRNDPPGVNDSLSYQKIKDWVLPTGNDFLNMEVAKFVRPPGNPGSTIAYTQPSFDDKGWRHLHLPHDWAIEGQFRQEYPGMTGK